jgi:hypothetical protein
MSATTPTFSLAQCIDPTSFLSEAMAATNVAALESILRRLPIVSEKDYFFDPDNPSANWKDGHLHWVPLGRDTGNAGRVRLASRPENPLAERAINAMEAVIEMMRLRELKAKPSAPPPHSPRDAVERYFGLPPLPELASLPRSHELRQKARELANLINLKVDFDKGTREFTVQIRDHGMGQTPEKIHRTLLSLGASDKGDKPYLIGVFGQGGSSAYMASPYSWCLSRRDPALGGTDGETVGWTAVKHVYPRGRRDDYFAYLAASPDGRVPSLPGTAADAAGFAHGTLFTHLRYDFSATGGSAISRTLFQSLNHVLYNPVLPLTTSIGGTPATIWGNAFRLADATARSRTAQDKSLPVATV